MSHLKYAFLPCSFSARLIVLLGNRTNTTRIFSDSMNANQIGSNEISSKITTAIHANDSESEKAKHAPKLIAVFSILSFSLLIYSEFHLLRFIVVECLSWVDRINESLEMFANFGQNAAVLCTQLNNDGP